MGRVLNIEITESAQELKKLTHNQRQSQVGWAKAQRCPPFLILKRIFYTIPHS